MNLRALFYTLAILLTILVGYVAFWLLVFIVVAYVTYQVVKGLET